MVASSSAEGDAFLPPLEFGQSRDTGDLSIADSQTAIATHPSGKRPASVSSADTIRFPTLPAHDPSETPATDDAPPDLDSSRSSLSTSTSTSTSASTSLDTPDASILRTASSSSSLPASHPRVPSILRTSTSFTLPKRTASGSIAFAPLPNVEPRRRQSTVALGVAARSRMLRHRRLMREQGLDPDDMPPWQDDAVMVADSEQEARRQRHHARHGDVEDDPFGAEDALASVTKLFKGASKTLFRRWSKKQKPEESGETPEVSHPDQPPVVVQGEMLESPRESKEHQVDVLHDEVGGVWEEEVGGGTWKLAEGTATAPEIKVTTASPGRRSSVVIGSVEVLKRSASFIR